MVALAIQHNLGENKILSEAFKKCGATGVYCDTAETGVELLLDSHCDLIILDLTSPGNKGMWALRKIREQGKFRDIPVIVLAPDHSRLSLVQCTALGVSEYLTTPLSADLIAQKISLLWRITLLTREVPDKRMLSNILIEEKRGVRVFRFRGNFSRYSVLQFQNLYTPEYRGETENDTVMFNFSEIPVFAAAQVEPFQLVREIIRPKKALFIAGKNFGMLMPLVPDPQSCLFMNEQDAMTFLDLSEQIS